MALCGTGEGEKQKIVPNPIRVNVHCSGVTHSFIGRIKRQTSYQEYPDVHPPLVHTCWAAMTRIVGGEWWPICKSGSALQRQASRHGRTPVWERWLTRWVVNLMSIRPITWSHLREHYGGFVYLKFEPSMLALLRSCLLLVHHFLNAKKHRSRFILWLYGRRGWVWLVSNEAVTKKVNSFVSFQQKAMGFFAKHLGNIW